MRIDQQDGHGTITMYARVAAIYKYEEGSGHQLTGSTLLLCEWLEAQAPIEAPRRGQQQVSNAYCAQYASH